MAAEGAQGEQGLPGAQPAEALENLTQDYVSNLIAAEVKTLKVSTEAKKLLAKKSIDRFLLKKKRYFDTEGSKLQPAFASRGPKAALTRLIV